MFALNQDLSFVFVTPLSLRTLKSAQALNAGLERAILSRRERSAGNRISNVGGWQSSPDLLQWPEPEVRMLAAEVDQAAQRILGFAGVSGKAPPETQKRATYHAYGWANVNASSDYNAVHVHPRNHLSVVYYVAAGRPTSDNEMNGRLELRDPRPAATFCRTPGSTRNEAILIQPEPGLMAVFPAWIEHWVHPFRGEGQRISIAINIAFDDLKEAARIKCTFPNADFGRWARRVPPDGNS